MPPETAVATTETTDLAGADQHQAADEVQGGAAAATGDEKTVIHGGRRLPRVLDTLKETKPDGEAEATAPAKAGKDKREKEDAPALSPRLQKAAEAIGMTAEELAGQTEALGADVLAKALTRHADLLKLDEQGSAPGAEKDAAAGDEQKGPFQIPQELKDAYSDSADLLGVIETGVNEALRAQAAASNTRLQSLEEWLLEDGAERLIESGGTLAEGVTVEKLLDEAETRAAGHAAKGTPISRRQAMKEALEFLTSPKAQKAAQQVAGLKAKVRAGQIQGRPGGMAAGVLPGEDGRARALRVIHKTRGELGL